MQRKQGLVPVAEASADLKLPVARTAEQDQELVADEP